MRGKKALVFGGTSGIGLATSLSLRSRGAEIVAISRSSCLAGDAEGIRLEACDVRDEQALAALFDREAPFDILISTATGGIRAFGPFMSMDIEDYRKSFDKLWGYTNCVRFGAEHLTANGTIVLVSGAPARRAKAGQSALASVGGAVEQFVRAVAVELAPRRINVVSPGLIDTPMHGPASVQRQRVFDESTATHLIPRAGTAQEVADAILFLVENEFVTGTTIDVDGGWILS